MAAEDTPPRFRSSGADGLRGDIDAQRPLVGLSRCVSVDLEVSTKTGRIHSFAGVRLDTGESFVYPSAGRRFDQALAELDALAEGADFVLGHNFIEFDMRHLQAANPGLRLLGMPMVDTLWLNPLAFPRNPYHNLVKHYLEGQLITGRKNDPEQDARIALEVFADQQKSLLEAPSDLLAAWHWLTGGQHGSGFDLVFRCLRRSAQAVGR